MNIEKYKIDYSKLKVGDKLWSIQSGDCELESMDGHSYPLRCANRDWGRTSYTKDGRHTIYDTHPSLFTSNPFAGQGPDVIGATKNNDKNSSALLDEIRKSSSEEIFTEKDFERSRNLIKEIKEKLHHAADSMEYVVNAKMGVPPESILQEAERLINGDRAAQYGDAKENFGDIAKGWSVLFKTQVTAEQVAIAMIWLKMCRFNHKEGRDSIVDIAGYAGCVEKIQKGGAK